MVVLGVDRGMLAVEVKVGWTCIGGRWSPCCRLACLLLDRFLFSFFSLISFWMYLVELFR